MLRKSIIQRAYELAEAGEATDLVTLKGLLNSEGYTQVDAHLEGRSVRAAIREIMIRKRSEVES